MQGLNNIRYVALLTFKEGIRHRTMAAVFFFALAMAAANIAFTGFFSWDLGKVSVEFGLSATAFCGLALIFFLGSKLISDDLEQHTVYFVLSRPVTRGQYIWGKFLGLCAILLAASIIMGLASAVPAGYVLWRYPGYSSPLFSWGKFFLALGFEWLSLMVVQAVAMFWFCFSSQSFLAILLSASTYFIGQNMEILRRALEKKGGAGPLLNAILVAISWIFPNLSFFDLKTAAAYGLPIDAARTAFSVIYALSYMALLLFLSQLRFGRRELG